MTRRAGCAAAVAVALVAAVALLRPGPPPGPVGGWMTEAGVAPAFADIGGVRVRYVRKGSGPAAVLLHGFASSIYTWKDVLPALADRHDVVAIDLPGFGGSGIIRPVDTAAYPAAVVALMDHLGLERAAMVGNSLGGSVAAMVAAERPDRVSHLVLIDSAGFNLDPADRPWLLRLVAAPGVAALAERLPMRRLVEAGLRQVFFRDELVTEERIDEYAAPMLRPGAARAAAELLASAGRPDFPGLLARVRAPSLVIWGRDDTWIPVEHASRFTAAIPGATAVVIESCGHVPQEEKPVETAALLRDFLAAPARVD